MVVRRAREQHADEYADDRSDEDELRDDELRDDERDSAEPPGLSAAEAGRAALGHITGLTTREPVGVTSVEPTEDGWAAEVEVIEERRIPSSSDMLALYSVDVDLDGTLLSYRRRQRYPRGRSGGGT